MATAPSQSPTPSERPTYVALFERPNSTSTSLFRRVPQDCWSEIFWHVLALEFPDGPFLEEDSMLVNLDAEAFCDFDVSNCDRRA